MGGFGVGVVVVEGIEAFETVGEMAGVEGVGVDLGVMC